MKRRLLLCVCLMIAVSGLAQKPNIAPAATITANGTSAPGCQTGACSTLNDLNYGTCGTQQMWINTSTPPSSNIGDDWIEWNWPTAQAFDEMTIHHAQNNARSLTGFLMQWWNGVQWVNGETFSNLPQQCINTVSFQRIVASRMRITQFQMTAPGQQSNPNFREIEIFQASTSNDDAGVTATNPVPAVCPGSYPVIVTIQNFGLNRIDSVRVSWEMDGVAQPSVMYSTQLDTIGGSGPSSAQVNLGNFNFAPGVTYTLKSWTSLPNNQNDTANFNDTLQLPIGLGAPTGLTVSNMTSTSATASWTTITGTSYGIIYGPTGFNPSTSGTTILPASMPYTMTGLMPTTVYDVYLFADCGGGVYSDTAAPESFATLISGPRGVDCDTANSSFIFVEEWDVQGPWSGDIGTGASTGMWNYHSGGTSSTNTGPNGAYSGNNYMYFEASGAGPASLISPPIDLTNATDSAEMAFWMHAYGADVGYLLIRVSTTSDTSGFNDTIFFYNQGQLQTGHADPWQHVGVRLDQYVGQMIWLEFEANRNNSFDGDIAIDLLTIEACGTFCLPEIFSIDSVNAGQNSATVFVDTFGGNFNVEWGPCGFTQGTGTILTGANGISITGLSPNTCYELYIRRDCGALMTGWGGPFQFNTLCVPYTAPHSENFDAVATPDLPACWSVIQTAVDIFTVTSTDHSATIPSSPNAVEINDGAPAVLISPEFSDLPTGQNQVRVKIAYEGGGTTFNDILYLGTMSDPTDLNSFSYYDTITMGNTNGDFIEKIFMLDDTSLIGANTYVAFNYLTVGGAYEFYIDDFNYEAIPPCPPPSDLGVTANTTDSVSLYWTTGGATGWEVEYGPAGFPTGTGTSVFSSNDTLTITGLSAATNYEFYVRDTCGPVKGNSSWVGPFAFATAPCDSSQGCIFMVNLYDTFGDGWNGGEVTLIQSGVPVGTFGSAFTTGDSLVGLPVQLCDNTPVQVVLSNEGGFPEEMELSIVSPFPLTVASHSASTTVGTGDTLLSFMASCALPSCPRPTSLSVINMADTAASLKWDTVSSTASYQVWFGPQGFFQGTLTTGGMRVITANDSLRLDTLVGGGCYQYLVRAICTPGDTSIWAGPVSFCTPCSPLGPITLPFYEGFELHNGPIATDSTYFCTPFYDWRVERPGSVGEVNFIYTPSSGPSAPYQGLRSAGLTSLSSNDVIYLILTVDMSNYATPTAADIVLSFYFADHLDETSPGDSVWARGSDQDPWIGLYDWNSANATTNWALFEMKLDSALAANNQSFSSTTQVRWGQQDNAAMSGGDGFSIDEVFIREVTCPRPRNLTATGITDTVANLGWTDTAALSGSFEVWFGPQGFYQGPGTLTGTHVMSSTNSLTLDTLSAQSCYEYLVRGICGPGDSSAWTGPFSFCTQLGYDAELSAILVPFGCGDSSTEVRVAFRNLGVYPITTMPVSVNVSGTINTTLTGTYNGNLSTNNYDTVFVGTLNTYNGANLNLDATVNLSRDQVAANDNLQDSVNFASIAPPQPTAAADTLCGTGQFDTLYFPSGGGSYYWISSTNDTIGTSDSLVVGPLLQQDTTFYLRGVGSVTYNVGPLDNSIGAGGNFTNPGVQQLYFSASSTFTLNSVLVYPNGAGNVVVNLKDPNGVILQTATVPVTGAGAVRIPVGFVVPPGSYELDGTNSTCGGLYRNSAGANYPYAVPGIMQITGNSFSPSYYYYFYDWEISSGGCPTADGEITIYNSGTAVVSAFTSSLGAPTATDLTVSFDATTSVGATSFAWDFGDGNTGNGMSPVHAYTTNGTYTVRLIASGTCGADTMWDTLVIRGINLEENLLSRSLEMYPNPAQDELNLSFRAGGSAKATIRITDASGKTVMLAREEHINGEYRGSLDIRKLADGVYMVEVNSGDLKAVRRLVKD